MDWGTAAAGAEVIGAIAVVVSLIYLAAQIKQNTRIVAATTFQSISSTSSEITMRLAENPQLSELMLRSISESGDLTQVELMQMQLLLRAMFRNYENYYYQYARGYLEEDMWNGYKQTMVDQISRDIGVTWWENHQVAFGKRFVDFVNKELEEHKSIQNPWKLEKRGGTEGDA